MGGAVGFVPPVIPENSSRRVRYHAHAVIINFYNLTFLAVRLFRFVNDDTVYEFPYNRFPQSEQNSIPENTLISPILVGLRFASLSLCTMS